MTVRIGALQADAWAGLVLSREPGEGFALRFAAEKDGETADLDDLFWLVHEVGPHEPEGRYARVSFDLDLPVALGDETPVPARERRTPPGADADFHDGVLVVEWGRTGESTVVGRATAGFAGTLLVRAYLPWDWEGRWRASGDGEATGVSRSGRSAAALRVQEVRAGTRATLAATDDGDGGAVFRCAVGPGDLIRFAAALGGTPAAARERARKVALEEVGDTLDRAAEAWEAARARVSGPLEGLAASVTRNIRWTVLLQPESGRLYTPAGRRWIFPRAGGAAGGQAAEGRAAGGGTAGGGTPAEEPQDAQEPDAAERDHWTVFGWDSYFNALELAPEAPAAARETLLTALRTQYPDGCVPNWRGRFGGTPDRSQPPVGSLAALKLHLRRPDRAMLEEAYPRLAAWSAWWAADHGGRPRRAPGPRGLFTWGSDPDLIDPLAPPWERDADARQLAAWESGQDDLPTWDEAHPAAVPGVLALDPVDLNAYRVLDLECLAGIADRLGRADEAAAHRRAADALRARVNEHLWDADRRTYADRLWDGPFTRCRSASHFLVLAAGIPPADRARSMVEHLTDPELFWGDFVIPTVSRDDPRFPEQQYWRGTIWPPINYLVHLGLARYGFDAVAGEVALRGARLFLRSWRRTGLCRENFDSRTGEGGGQRHQSWGPLFALAALEELADVTPWDGLRVGGLRLPDGTEARNLDFGERGMLRVAAGSDFLEVSVNGRAAVESRGAVVLRHVSVEDGRFAAESHAEGPVELRVHLEADRWTADVDGRREELAEPRLRLGPGRHRLEIRRAG